MADDDKLKSVTGLPTQYSDDLPDYFWKPKLAAIDDVIAGRSNWNVEGNAHGKEFKFIVQTVLEKGVPGPTRSAFEAEIAERAAGLRSQLSRWAESARKSGLFERGWLIATLAWGNWGQGSDIDVVVQHLAAGKEASTWDELMKLTGHKVDLLRLEELPES